MLIVVSLLILPILEVWAAIVVAGWIGVLPTVLALIGLSVAGVVLVRSEGLAVWRRANEELAAGRPPTDSLLDGLMVVVGGLLLIVPGWIAWTLISVWFLYRVVRGWLALSDRKPMPA